MRPHTEIFTLPVFTDDELDDLFDQAVAAQQVGEFLFEMTTRNSPAHPQCNSPSDEYSRRLSTAQQRRPATQTRRASATVATVVAQPAPVKITEESLTPAVSSTRLPALPAAARPEIPSAWSKELRALCSTILVAAKTQKQRSFLVSEVTPGADAGVITRSLSKILPGLCNANILYCGLAGTEANNPVQPPQQTTLARQNQEPFYLRLTGQPTVQEMTTSNGARVMTELLLRYDLPYFMAQLKQAFDLVLFDAPPITSHAEVELLAAHVDGVILVVRPGVTTKAEIQKVQARLQKAEANVLGVVFQQAAQKRRRPF